MSSGGRRPGGGAYGKVWGEEAAWEVLQEEWIGDEISILKGLYSLRYCFIFQPCCIKQNKLPLVRRHDRAKIQGDLTGEQVQ